MGQTLNGTEFTTKILSVNPKTKLVGVDGLILYSIINVVVGYAGACAKGYLTTEVGKEVEPVVVVMFGDGQFAVQYKPVNEVGELTESAPDTF